MIGATSLAKVGVVPSLLETFEERPARPVASINAIAAKRKRLIASLLIWWSKLFLFVPAAGYLPQERKASYPAREPITKQKKRYWMQIWTTLTD
jgi:hypothetical protein